MDADPPTTRPAHAGGPVRLLCRICGYDVTSLDWPRASYRCPECGQINIPGDLHVAPIAARPWPSFPVAALLLLWPGLATAAGIVLGLRASHPALQLCGIFMGMLGGIETLAWPWVGASLLMYQRVPERERGRYMLWLAPATMMGNLALTVVLARVALVAWK